METGKGKILETISRIALLKLSKGIFKSEVTALSFFIGFVIGVIATMFVTMIFVIFADDTDWWEKHRKKRK